MSRLITKREEQAYRLCHHDFEHKTVSEAAKVMGTSEGTVRRLLRNVKRVCPQLFPILTKRQFMIYKLRIEVGLTEEKTANMLRTTHVHRALNKIKKQDLPELNIEGFGDMLSYDPNMDSHIKQKF